VVLIVTTQPKLVGLELLSLRESLMVSCVFTMLHKKRLLKFLMMSMKSYKISVINGVLIKDRLWILLLVSSMITRVSQLKLKSKTKQSLNFKLNLQFRTHSLFTMLFQTNLTPQFTSHFCLHMLRTYNKKRKALFSLERISLSVSLEKQEC